MNPGHDSRLRHMSGPRLLARLDKLVAAGRITDKDAARLRDAAESGDLDAEVQRIRLTHVKGRADAAVDEGRLTRAEADAELERFQRGERPRFVRRR